MYLLVITVPSQQKEVQATISPLNSLCNILKYLHIEFIAHLQIFGNQHYQGEKSI